MVTRTAFKTREEWLKNRTHIGGSDAAALLGISPWKTNIQLWMEKTGRAKAEDISNKPVVLYGTNAEAPLRELFKLDFPQYEVLYEENNSWANDKYPYMAASLDGWLIEKETGKRGIFECKTATRAWEKDKIPDYYYTQLLLYLAVTEFDFAVLKCQHRYEKDGEINIFTNHYRIDREEVIEDINYLIEKVKEFAGYIERDEQPPLILPEF